MQIGARLFSWLEKEEIARERGNWTKIILDLPDDFGLYNTMFGTVDSPDSIRLI